MNKQVVVSGIEIFSATDYFDSLYGITPELREKLPKKVAQAGDDASASKTEVK